MANEQNLVSLATRSQREREEIARKGGFACAVAKKERKTMKEHLLAILQDENIQDDILKALVQKAIDGNVKAFEVIRDTIGENPQDAIVVVENPPTALDKLAVALESLYTE